MNFIDLRNASDEERRLINEILSNYPPAHVEFVFDPLIRGKPERNCLNTADTEGASGKNLDCDARNVVNEVHSDRSNSRNTGKIDDSTKNRTSLTEPTDVARLSSPVDTRLQAPNAPQTVSDCNIITDSNTPMTINANVGSIRSVATVLPIYAINNHPNLVPQSCHPPPLQSATTSSMHQHASHAQALGHMRQNALHHHMPSQQRPPFQRKYNNNYNNNNFSNHSSAPSNQHHPSVPANALSNIGSNANVNSSMHHSSAVSQNSNDASSQIVGSNNNTTNSNEGSSIDDQQQQASDASTFTVQLITTAYNSKSVAHSPGQSKDSKKPSFEHKSNYQTDSAQNVPNTAQMQPHMPPSDINQVMIDMPTTQSGYSMSHVAAFAHGAPFMGAPPMYPPFGTYLIPYQHTYPIPYMMPSNSIVPPGQVPPQASNNHLQHLGGARHHNSNPGQHSSHTKHHHGHSRRLSPNSEQINDHTSTNNANPTNKLREPSRDSASSSGSAEVRSDEKPIIKDPKPNTSASISSASGSSNWRKRGESSIQENQQQSPDSAIELHKKEPHAQAELNQTQAAVQAQTQAKSQAQAQATAQAQSQAHAQTHTQPQAQPQSSTYAQSDGTMEAKTSDQNTASSGSMGRSWADLLKHNLQSEGNSNGATDSIDNSNKTSTDNSKGSAAPPSTANTHPLNVGRTRKLGGMSNSRLSSESARQAANRRSKDTFAPRLAKKLREITLKHSLPFLRPRGFINRGNGCYINATLQALVACPPFYNLMREIGEVKGIKRENSCTPILDSFSGFFLNFIPIEPNNRKARPTNTDQRTSIEDLQAEPIEPKSIYDVLGSIKSECLKGAQEDAEEFLSSVLNSLHEEMVDLFELTSKNESDDVSGDGPNARRNAHEEAKDDTDDDDDNRWREVGPRNRSLPIRSTKVVNTPIQGIFGGSLFSLRTSSKDRCGHKQPFFALQLDISNENIKSVQDAIKSFTTPESIHDFYCSKTKQKQDALCQTSLDQLPPILILHLKQFVYSQDQGLRKLVRKIEYPIDFELPDSCLHDRNYHDRNRNSRSYKLLAVVYHDGSEAIKGHYLTDVFHIGSSQWIRCDDSSLKVITTQQLLSPEPPRTPYLLFYRRLNTLRASNRSMRD
ncbi:Ubiquitin carboxyl-terminal hydrolase 10 [Fragariocoptes setiger]|uniref:ubiquitinyl hydrolase 1 n=1 Tax=Fragariocoptes setiger TaxID=1670756 RepID=A0ABQ7S7E1_9ACAR|nr:Ubiquitin carboxyl-terminal hydrolase 10 [Fragariocoptes setiger]